MDVHDVALLRLAGKAANIPHRVIGAVAGIYWIEETKSCHQAWNPLTNDADAFRLAIDLGMMKPGCFPDIHLFITTKNSDMHAVTRRAIVVAAALIGARM